MATEEIDKIEESKYKKDDDGEEGAEFIRSVLDTVARPKTHIEEKLKVVTKFSEGVEIVTVEEHLCLGATTMKLLEPWLHLGGVKEKQGGNKTPAIAHGKANKCYYSNSKMLGYSFQQWDPGGEIGPAGVCKHFSFNACKVPLDFIL